ncbi:MAG: hypothetical protein AB2693_11785 [Candidatus Thiodiazotropha sp.]
MHGRNVTFGEYVTTDNFLNVRGNEPFPIKGQKRLEQFHSVVIVGKQAFNGCKSLVQTKLSLNLPLVLAVKKTIR